MTIKVSITGYDSSHLLEKYDIAVTAGTYNNIFELFNTAYDYAKNMPVSKTFSFYDYSKHIDHNFELAKRLGYHLTLSAGSLFDTLSTAIENGLNYAGVLNIKRNAPMPKFITVKGIKLPVIDGDLTDWRIGDSNQTTHVVGLRVKRTPNQTETMRRAFCIA
jgi:hypothetical protein